ncbi:MAG: hypothetical protein HOC23_07155 [Halieaceae bacterium]|jgi:hypothetical protein|nr:hypothetical protein [Halieaceae bacterium]
MNIRYCRKTTASLLVALFLINSEVVLANEDKSLSSEFQRVLDSFMGSEMVLSCGESNMLFKIASGLFGGPELLWNSGTKWRELKRVTFEDTSIVFNGPGTKGGVPLEDIDLDLDAELDIPIFNSGPSLVKEHSVRDYIVKAKDGKYVPYQYTIDLVQGSMKTTNLRPITTHLKLDADKYSKEQSHVEGWYFHYVDPKKVDQEKKREEKAKEARMAEIAAVIEKYGKEITIETPAHSYHTTGTCSLP